MTLPPREQVLPVRRVTCSMSTSLDGCVTAPDGGLDWGSTGEEVFRLATDEVRAAGVHLLGRRLYEAMLYWETHDEHDAHAFSTREFAELWQRLPKVVFSRTLSTVQGNARLATAGLAEEIARLRAEPGEGDIAIGGATLAAAAAAAGLVDEYRVRIHPVLLGGGLPLFPQDERRVPVELLESRALACGVLYVRYGVVREGTAVSAGR